MISPISYLLEKRITTPMVGVILCYSLTEIKDKIYPNQSHIFDFDGITYGFTFSDHPLQTEISRTLCLLVIQERNQNEHISSFGFDCDEYSFGIYKYTDSLYYVSFETFPPPYPSLSKRLLCCINPFSKRAAKTTHYRIQQTA